MNAEHSSREYLTGKQVATRYQITPVSLYRWERDQRLGFPQPMIVNRRKLFKIDELIAWERSRAKGTA
ncbi:DNA-binding protein [Rhizobium leguminosarum]|jgi:predicted DNA-binding transcriptional regulator AlpA|uniref:helix-turn-helix transcriptional regulator n=1 Tax=Rhizobium leguminosarum TaxID=384 RepID=UPI001C8FBD12|nr:helix-turn-helix domain-containing protein [Rhizobium leguminosarum]MBY2993761.1 DNA-binding protein [Rhizobium leguminosarum]MBY3055211.1 DNA-binding protein [Rhizobium leguminosarum]